MHLQPVSRARPVYGGDVSARLFERGLCLPSGSALADDDQRRVVETLLRLTRAPARAATYSTHCDHRSLRPVTVSRRPSGARA